MSKLPDTQLALGAILESAPSEIVDAFAEWVGMPEFSNVDVKPKKQLVINFQTLADVDAFAQLINQRINLTTKSVWFPAKQRNDYSNAGWASVSDDADAIAVLQALDALDEIDGDDEWDDES